MASCGPKKSGRNTTRTETNDRRQHPWGAFFWPDAPAACFGGSGHFHWQGIWHSGHRLMINTGSFMIPGRAQWVELENGWLTRGEIEESPELCRIGQTLGVWRF